MRLFPKERAEAGDGAASGLADAASQARSSQKRDSKHDFMRRHEEAMEWVLRLNAADVTTEERLVFTGWLASDRAHASAFHRAKRLHWMATHPLTPQDFRLQTRHLVAGRRRHRRAPLRRVLFMRGGIGTQMTDVQMRSGHAPRDPCAVAHGTANQPMGELIVVAFRRGEPTLEEVFVFTCEIEYFQCHDQQMGVEFPDSRAFQHFHRHSQGGTGALSRHTPSRWSRAVLCSASRPSSRKYLPPPC